MTGYGNIVVIPLADEEIHVSLQEYEKLGRGGCIKKYYIPLGKSY